MVFVSYEVQEDGSCWPPCKQDDDIMVGSNFCRNHCEYCVDATTVGKVGCTHTLLLTSSNKLLKRL